MIPEPLAALAAYRQFIVCNATKMPCDYRTGTVIDAHDPQYWTDYETAAATGMRVGFVFTEGDPFWFLDIDKCLTAEGWSPIAQQLCGALTGCAIEVSQSGRGLHIFGVGKPPAHGCRNGAYGLEFYHAGRYVALTGTNAIGNCAFDASSILPSLVATYFPADTPGDAQGWSDTPDSEWYGPSDDTELIRRAMHSRSVASAFGNRASFADLWLADEAALARAYPAEGRPYDASSADAALAQHLAFWTGKNHERIRTLMGQSKLVREKWEREDYLPRTITAAVARQVDVLKDARPTTPTIDISVTQIVTGNTMIGLEDQLKLFAGAIYIQEQHRALIPGGKLLKPEQFRVQFGGYQFQMDALNERMSKDPWDAWTQSRLFRCPKVDGTCFRPDLPFGEIVERTGQKFVNTYVPINVLRQVGDAKPFVDHLVKVLPNEHDREILMSYMAACVQHKGIKFQWAPLLQGVEGNGKTLFARCVAEAVGRRYVHWPKASKLSKEFNAWMVGKLFFPVEDIYVPDARREVIEELKPLITGGDGLEIEAKGVDQVSADICGNFMFNSNHRDAVKKTRNDRRFCLLFSAQQQTEDLTRDGMQGDYFPNLYKWLRAEGYAIVAELLHTYPIPAAYNPAGECQRAPQTTSTEDAIRASTGGVEQEIEEAVAQGLPGFAGGWISSIWLERLLERLGLARRITHSKRKEMLEHMGYYYHPALTEGRVNNTVTPDNGKPRLFIHEKSLARQITVAAEVAKEYERVNAGRPDFQVRAQFR
jgi:hypothetical protein